ncbi:DUF1737 domain-containing protein [Lactococcus petauri]|uniref:DUF1737 domain-containing protein n=2 Tax=Streptococcaceae TaxID=1300 RepID=UPI0030D4A91D
MKYRVLEGEYTYKLAEKVNELIAKGWKPQGGVTAYSHGMSTYYCQAMILGDKYEIS